MQPFVNLNDIPLTSQTHGEAYEARMGQIGKALGAELLGCRVTVLAPGKKAWPYHSHHGNEEMFVIVDGHGTLRHGGERFAVKPGDVIMCRAGGPETAHQLINTGTAELRYLAISTMNEPDVAEYPDSGKVGVMAGAPRGDKAKRRLQFCGRLGDGVDYWDGED